jgi:hypothetical protein
LYAAFFRVSYSIQDTAVGMMLLARLQSAAVALAGLGLLYLIARRIGRSRLEAGFAVAVVLAFSSYIEWAFMVRPEPLALGLATCALWVVVRSQGSWLQYLLAGLLSGLAFLVMQKAAYFNLALGLALVGDALARRSLGRAFLWGTLLVLGWATAVGGYALFFAFQGADPGGILVHIFAGPAVENVVQGHVVYGGLRHFVARTLLRDPMLYALCAGGLVAVSLRFFRLTGPERRAWIYSIVIVVLVFTHRSPWPYNFVMAIPFLGLWSTVLPRVALSRSGLIPVVLLGIVVLFLVLSFVRNVSYLAHDNRFQKETMYQAESLLGSDDAYADGIRMLATRKDVVPSWWDRAAIAGIRARAEAGDVAHFEGIFGGAPKVWILTYRSDALADVLAPYLEQAYVPIFPNVLITGVELRPGSTTEFQNWWPGAYRLYRPDGSPAEVSYVIDGQQVAGIVQIDRGEHSVQMLAGERPLYLLPADISLPFDLGRPPERRPLFDRVYTF